MLQNKEQWTANLQQALERAKEQHPLPYTATVELETPGMIEGYIERIHAALGTLRDQLTAYRPDALIMIGDDQGELFGAENNPTFSIYTGEEQLWGRKVDHTVPRHEDREKVYFPVHPELSRYLLKGLIKKGFDVSNVAKFEPRGPEAIRGVSHMVAHVVPQINPALDIPVIVVMLNEYYPPLPSAERCAQLGRAIAEVFADRPERIAICASGGLSHYPGMFNRLWIDQPLDHWFLERLERNDLAALNHLFTFDSDNVRSGAGELRAWISVANAMNRGARVVDYVPAHGANAALGFTCWPAVEAQDRTYEEATAAAARQG
jgi:protocatechuate 4,5-dioxygenase beta chain